MRGVIYLFFFLSGMSGLLYEVVWIRTAGTVIGNTTYAIGTVVGVYMGGLALGAWLGGRAADRRSGAKLLALYGALEVAVGVSAVAVPFLILASEPLFRVLWNSMGYVTALYATLRVLLMGVLLIVPTTLMGATLPILARYFATSHEDAAAEAGRAYGINTFGGVLGTLLGGFWLIPTFGLRITTGLAIALNLAIGAASVALARGKGGDVQPAASTEPTPDRLPLIVSAVSGMAALCYEVAWTRALILAMGSTIYSFTLILAGFILGLATGSAIASRLLDRIREARAALAVVQAAIGAAAILLLPFLGDLSIWFSSIVSEHRRSYSSLLLAQSGLVFLFVSFPTLLMGAVFPLTCRLAARSSGSVGRSVAAVYTWNTAGSIAGTLLGSFALVPAVGLAATVKLAAMANLVVAAVLFFRLAGRWRLGVAGAVAAMIVTWILPAWNPKVLAAGSFIYADRHISASRQMNLSLREYLEKDTEILTEEWDPYGLVTVHRNPRTGLIDMRINGKVDASSKAGDMITQLYVAHLPVLHHPDPKRALVIGLGAGVSLGAVTRHPLEKIDCIEISDAVARAARHFEKINHGCLNDSRVRLVIGDGRNAVLFGRESYDLIICQPSNLWLSGMANLFTQDFFRESKERLATGGIFCQWIHAYRLSTEDFKSVIRTFYSVFEGGSVWEVFAGNDYVLLGTREPLKRPYGELEKMLSDASRAPELLDPTFPGAMGLMGHLLMDAATARTAAGSGTIITDDRCAVEYTAPRSMYMDERPATLEWLDAARRSKPEQSLYDIPDSALADRVAARREGRRLVAEAMRLYSRPRAEAERDGVDYRGSDALRMMEEAGAKHGRDRETQEFFNDIAALTLDEGIAAAKQGRTTQARVYLRSIPGSSSRHADAQRILKLLP